METRREGWLPPKSFSSSAVALEPKCDAASASETERVARSMRVLVAGAGALGCEILRTLALHGVKEIAVIDMDVIEESNLNRQSLFSSENIGQSKALTAAAALRERFRDCDVVGYHAAIQDMPLDFFRSFHVIVSGLDSVEARRWLNSCIFHIARPVGLESARNASYAPVLIDGGTEGLAGQARTIRPYETACIECTVDLYANEGTQYPLCTVVSTPKEPEHCIEYAASVLWPSQHNGSLGPLDPYNAEHIEWVYGRALQQAEQFGIDGVTVSLVKHVLQHSVPAVATTNAFIGAACALEVVKLANGISHPVATWLAFNGTSGICIQSLHIDRRYSCPICGPEARITIHMSGKAPLRELVELLRTHPELRCRNPSLVWAYRPIYMSAPRPLEEVTRQNLDKPLNQILIGSQNGENSAEFILTLTDSGLRLSREMHLILH